MKCIKKELKINTSAEVAFTKFIHELRNWWPREYTWSQDKLKDITIDGKQDGLCTETGPYGFRCDWGRVTELSENETIRLKWQIGPNREPVPDPGKASDVLLQFNSDGLLSTILEFEHTNFENHGDQGAAYLEAMDSRQGWDYILKSFKEYCEK